MLDLFHDDIFAVDQDENVTRTEVRCIRPALDRTIERVRRRGNNFLAAHENVRQLGRLVDIGFDDRLERNVPVSSSHAQTRSPALIFSIATRPVAVATVVPATKHAPFFK